MKQVVSKQLGDIRDKKILDFGSGIVMNANYLAEHNDVTAIEPGEDRPNIVKEFAGILELDGKISIVKHNRAGRLMQMGIQVFGKIQFQFSTY